MNNLDVFADLPDAPVVEEKVDGRKKKSSGPKQRSFFDCLQVIVQSKDKAQMERDIASSSFDTFFSKYMCQRYISMHPPFLKYVNNNQQALESMTNEMFYRYMFKVIPQNKYLWIKYISKKKNK